MAEQYTGRITYAHQATFYASADPSVPYEEVWIVFHGYGQLARFFLRKFSGVMNEQRLIIAPEATNYFYREGFSGRVGSTWMTKEKRDLAMQNYVAYINELADVVANRVITKSARLCLLGFSQGVATVTRWAVQTHLPVSKMILWAGSIPPEMNLALLPEPIYLVVGNQDELVSPDRINKEAERLKAAGKPFTLHPYEGGHDVEPQPLKELIRM